MSALLRTIRNQTQISDEEGAYVLSFFKEKKYKYNTHLLREGNVAHEVFFILKGSLRQYFIMDDGAEKTCNICFENEFLTDLESFSRQSRSVSNIVTMEPSECLVISCKDLSELIKNSSAIAEFFRRVVEIIATENIHRIKSLLSPSPQKQFEELIKSKPQILQRVPQRYIAQYIGIAPESLSRIRKSMIPAQKS